MSHKPSAVLVLILAFCPLLAFTQDQHKLSEYAALLARVKSGDLSIDFKQLRVSYMDSPERHQAKDTDKQEKEMLAALKTKDYTKAIANADIILENEFINLDAQRVELIAHQELGEKEKTDFHKGIVQGLIHSILDSGDGKTPETAYTVVTVHEEYVVLQVLGFRPAGQSVISKNGHSYDVLDVKKQDSKDSAKLYFNVDIPFKHYLN
jgi:uncharacterized protein DUF4919